MQLSKEQYSRKRIHNGCLMQIETPVTQDNCSASGVKNTRVSTNPTDPVSIPAPTMVFSSVKKKKKYSARPYEISGSAIFFFFFWKFVEIVMRTRDEVTGQLAPLHFDPWSTRTLIFRTSTRFIPFHSLVNSHLDKFAPLLNKR